VGGFLDAPFVETSVDLSGLLLDFASAFASSSDLPEVWKRVFTWSMKTCFSCCVRCFSYMFGQRWLLFLRQWRSLIWDNSWATALPFIWVWSCVFWTARVREVSGRVCVFQATAITNLVGRALSNLIASGTEDCATIRKIQTQIEVCVLRKMASCFCAALRIVPVALKKGSKVSFRPLLRNATEYCSSDILPQVTLAFAYSGSFAQPLIRTGRYG